MLCLSLLTENAYPDLVKVFMNEAQWSTEVPALLLQVSKIVKKDTRLHEKKKCCFFFEQNGAHLSVYIIDYITYLFTERQFLSQRS